MIEQYANLSTLVSDICQRIDALDPQTDSEKFALQLIASNPRLFEEISDDLYGDDIKKAARAVAAYQIDIIKEIPTIVEALLDVIDRKSVEPAMRCALIGALGYLVQPHDLLPDKMPGGFGFVDDCMMLRAATSEFLNVLPSNFTTRERERQFLDILAICIPMDQTSEFQGAIEGIRLAFHIYLWQPVDEVEARIEQLIHDPLGTKLSEPESTTVPLPTIPVLTIDPKKDRIRKDGSQYMIVFGKGGRVTIP